MFNYKTKKQEMIYYFLLVLLGVLISLSLKTNGWNKEVIGVDSSVFISIGEKMHTGEIPYRDVFDHKGPILYFINYIGTITSDYIFLWLIETAFVIIDINILFKIANNILNNKLHSLLATLIVTLTFPLVLQGGNFAEEYTLPFSLAALLIFLEIQKARKTYIINGILLGIVVMLKFNMISVWCVGYSISLVKFLYNKDYKEIMKMILYSLVGIMCVMIPIIIYLIINGAFYEFIRQYIIFNLKYSTSNDVSIIKFIYKNINLFYIPLLIVGINIYYIILFKLKNNKKHIYNLLLSLMFLILTLVTVIIPRNAYWHYWLALIPCYIVPIAYFIKFNVKIKKEYAIELITIMYICLFVVCINIEKSDAIYPDNLTEVCNRIEKITDKDADVLVLGNRLIVNLLSNRTTNCKYIYQSPISDIDTNIKIQVKQYIYDNMPDVIVLTTNDEYFEQVLLELIQRQMYNTDSKYDGVIIKNGEK